MKTVSSDYVVRYHESFMNVVGGKKSQVIIMEYCEGASLERHIERLSEGVNKELMLQVSEGVKALHDKHIGHRDLKPENVMITGDGVAKIGDFGLSKASENDRFETNVGTNFYKPR